MKLKTLVVCDDIRVEVGGTLTLVGVYNERLLAPPGEGPVELPRLSFLGVVSGLAGIERLRCRQWIRIADAPIEASLPLTVQTHDPSCDEHNFVFGQAPALFPEPGRYEVALDVEAGDERASYRYAFAIERRPGELKAR